MATSVRVTLLLAALVAAVFVCPALTPFCEFDRAAVAGGELWRLVTCHLTHFSWDHLLWDTVVLVFLGLVCERRGRARYVSCLTASALAIAIAVYLAAPQVGVYRGLSGVDTALFAMLAASLIREKWAEEDWMWVGLLGILSAGLVGKVLFEMVTGGTLFVAAEAAHFRPVPLAHLVGMVVGCVMGAADVRYHPYNRKTGREAILESETHIFCEATRPYWIAAL